MSKKFIKYIVIILLFLVNHTVVTFISLFFEISLFKKTSIYYSFFYLSNGN